MRLGIDVNCGSISHLIHQAKDGDEQALGDLHRRYWPQLVNLARKRLRGSPSPASDEEDVAQSAFFGLYENFRRGRVPQMENRHQLLALLTHIVACKAVNQLRRGYAQKRGGGAVRPLADLQAIIADDRQAPVQQAILRDCYQHYLDALPENLRRFAELHLSGMTNEQIAAELGCVQRTVERKLALLRLHWQELAADSLAVG